MTEPKPPSLNNHEKARRELWSGVFVAEFSVSGSHEPLVRAANAADHALKAFDNRFKAPK